MTTLPDDIRPWSDAELISAVRDGDDTAYGELYQRHADSARAAAASMTRSKAEIDDLVSEAFARVLQALRRGGGPDVAFRAYLLTSVRNAFYDRARRDRRLEVTPDPPDSVNEVLLSASMDSEDQKMVAVAFASLPERWQLVLWHTEVEGRQPAEIAPLLGIQANAVAALAYRAREGLRQAYLQAHLQQPVPATCADTVPKLGAYSRDGLSNRDRRHVDDHLSGCTSCTALLAEVTDANRQLRAVLIPALIGVPASTYLGGGLLGGGLAGLLAWVKGQPRNVAIGAAAACLGVFGVIVGTLALTGGDDAPDAAPPRTDAPSPTGGGTSSLTPSGSTTAPTAAPSAPSSTSTPTSSAPVVVPVTTRPVLTTPPPVTAATTAPATASSSTAATTVAPTTSAATTTAAPTTSSPATTAATTTAAPTTTSTTTTTTTVPPAPSLSITTSALGPAYRGSLAHLQVGVANAAARSVRSVGPATDPTVNVALATGVTFVEVQGTGWSCIAGATEVACTLPDLAPGASTEAVLVFSLDSGVDPLVTLAPRVGSGSSVVVGTPIGVTVADGPQGVDYRVARGSVWSIGNTVLTCDDSSTGCVDARNGAGSLLNRFDHRMQVVDVDADPTTVNSSSALLDVGGARVLAARLAWGGDTSDGSTTSTDPTLRGAVRLTAPGGATTSISATTLVTMGDGSLYHASADVTALVRSAGDGTYTVADVQAAAGSGTFGGWSLTMIVEDTTKPRRALAIVEPVARVDSATARTVALPGFVAGAHARTWELTAFSYEGELGFTPDVLAVDGTPVSNPTSPSSNVFNSSIDGTRIPSHANSFAVDIDRFTGTTSAGDTFTVSASSGFESFLLGVVALAVDL